MAVYDSGDKVQKWRYEVKSLYILSGGTKIEIPPERVAGITLSYDYLQNLYPIFKLDIVISSDTYYLIQQNKNNLKIYIRIDKMYYIEDKGKKADGSQASAYKPWLNDTFEIIMDQNTEDMFSALNKDQAKNDYTKVKKGNANDLPYVDNGISLYLYKSYTALKANVNKIIKNANVTDAIAWLMTKAGIKNVIMQQPENNKTYDIILIPPSSISKALYFIDTYYGIYKLGTIFFSDFDYFYIIPFDCNNRTAFINNDTKTTNIVVPSSGSTGHSNEVGSLQKKNGDKSNYVIVNTGDINISNKSISNDLISGSNAMAVDSFSGELKETSSGATTHGDTTTKLVTNTTENDFYSSMQSALSKSLSTEIKVTSASFDVDAIKPNKVFSFMFEDSSFTAKYQGKYIITAATHSFTKEGEALNITSTMVFRKMK